jgi:uncharacterized membrane protein YsdA (DUF1294 family)
VRYVLILYAVASVMTFIAYGLDKRAAYRQRRRIPESTLHVLELFGGFAGAFIAQHVFRHKRRKRTYMLVFWAIVLLHAAGWYLWLALAGWLPRPW